MMDKCFVGHWDFGAHILYMIDIYVEMSMTVYVCITVTKDIVLMYDVACDADFYLTKRQIVLRVRDSEIQRWEWCIHK